MKEVIEYLSSFNLLTVLIRTVLAMLAGGIIGLERGKQGRAAGMRTHILVCMGAALNARVDKVFFGAYEQKGRSLTNELAEANLLNHKTEVTGGVLEGECSSLLTDFFVSMRKKAKEEK